ncbi:IS3 family transposase [Lentzea alba]|uniref:IS3 family transposase n=1 Tax=Lentzea alba TaxID=2714351 RepID=UPI0039BFB731
METENPGGSGNVGRACELLKVSPRRLLQPAHRRPSGRARADAVSTEKIIEVHDESNGTYGMPWIRPELTDQGHPHPHKRMARLLREADRAGRAPKRWRTPRTPDSAATTWRPDQSGILLQCNIDQQQVAQGHHLHQDLERAVPGHRDRPRRSVRTRSAGLQPTVCAARWSSGACTTPAPSAVPSKGDISVRLGRSLLR